MANHNRGKLISARQAILTTILYSDIFHFPLSKEELWRFLIAKERIPRKTFEESLESFPQLFAKDGYYCLRGREALIAKRKADQKEFTKKMQRAWWVAGHLAIIPTILFIGITGGLAAGSVTKDDDIDLVIIVKKNTLFVSRLLLILILEGFGVRRRWGQRHTADTVCVNLLLDETALSWFENFQDLYTARELAQISPLFERDKAYHRLLAANKWLYKFLPNVHAFAVPRKIGTIKSIPVFIANPFFESLFRFLQLSRMKRHHTREIVKKDVLAFHPIDYRSKTLKQLSLKMRQFGLLTKI